MKKNITQFHLPALLIATLFIVCSNSTVASSDLDDISIQVIGLDDIPEDALERIPVPTPDHNGLTDIREGIILNRPVQAQPAPTEAVIGAPPGIDEDPAPPGENTGPK